MPTRPTNFRPAQGAGSQAEALERRRSFDRQRRAETETRRLYGTARWQAKRAHQLRLEPLCRMCRAEQRITIATVADHVEPHRGDVEAFWSNELQSLCDWHHNAAKQAEERAADRNGEGASKVWGAGG